MSPEPDKAERPKSQWGWKAVAPLAALITALGVFSGPFVTGLFNLISSHSKTAAPFVSGMGGQRAATHAPQPVPSTGNPPAVNSSGTPLPSAIPPARISPAPPAATSSIPSSSSRPATPAHADPSHNPQSPLETNFGIIVHNTPSEAGIYPAPLKLSWSAIVTLNGQVVTSECSIYWSLYLGPTLYYQTSAIPCASSSVNDLLLYVGDYRLVGKVVIRSADPVVVSVPIPVGP